MPFPSRAAAIVGVYLTQQGKNLQRSTIDLEIEALKGALDDAGMSFEDLDGIASSDGTSPVGSSLDARQYWAEQLGQHPIGLMTVGSAPGAIAKTALAISAGMCDSGAILSGGMARGDAALLRAPGANLSGGRARESAAQRRDPSNMDSDSPMPRHYVDEWDYRAWGGSYVSHYAMWCQRYMHEFGVSSADLAEVAVVMRRHATLTKSSVMGHRGEITVEDVLTSPLISSPLHRLDCALVNEGGWAIILASAERAKGLRKPPIWVLGGAEAAYTDRYSNIASPWFHHPGAVRRAGDRAFQMSGVGRNDIDVAGLYDCFTITMLRNLEELGYCDIGEGASFVKDGNISLGGSLPVNTHGGLLSHSHNGRVDGIGAIDVVQQLRGEVEPERQVSNAEVGLALAQGAGVHSTASVVILGTD
jgi:acetyl-CoA acetyltransferase